MMNTPAASTDRGEHGIAAAVLQPRQRVAGQRAEEDPTDRHHAGDDHAVEEPQREVGLPQPLPGTVVERVRDHRQRVGHGIRVGLEGGHQLHHERVDVDDREDGQQPVEDDLARRTGRPVNEDTVAGLGGGLGRGGHSAPPEELSIAW
jgi:hypothetical protein